MRELAEIVRDTMPGCELEFAGDAPPDTRNYRVDCSKIARALPSFVPRWTARKGAAQLYEAYRDRGISLEEIEGYRYRRRHTVTGRIARHLHLDCSGVARGLWERRSRRAWRYDLLLPERLPDHDTSHG